MKLRTGLTLCALCLLVSGSAFAEAAPPRRIVSLGPVITEELFLLGSGESVVGRSHYCTKPEEARKIEEVGNVVELSTEKIVALRPDLVLTTGMTDPGPVEKLKRLGIPVMEFPQDNNFKGICDSFLRLGQTVGKEKEARELIRSAEAGVNAVRASMPSKTKPAVFLEIGLDPLVTITKESYLNDLIESAGGTNVARDARRSLYSREKVLAQNPDVILIVSMGFDGEEEKKTWQGYGGLSAARQGRIYIVDSDLFCAPTPLSFVKALKVMKEMLGPKP